MRQQTTWPLLKYLVTIFLTTDKTATISVMIFACVVYHHSVAKEVAWPYDLTALRSALRFTEDLETQYRYVTLHVERVINSHYTRKTPSVCCGGGTLLIPASPAARLRIIPPPRTLSHRRNKEHNVTFARNPDKSVRQLRNSERCFIHRFGSFHRNNVW